jgi:hypothetical protein
MILDFRYDMKKSKLNSRERNTLRAIGDDALDLRHNWQRRFRNALLCLVLSDRRWMVWVDQNIDPERMSVQEMTRLIEARARLIVLKPYNYFGRNCIGNYIFRDDWAFTDRGNLGPG